MDGRPAADGKARGVLVMSDIQNLENVRLVYPFVAQPAEAVHERQSVGARRAATVVAAALRDVDVVEISPDARKLAAVEDVRSMNERLRKAKVARIRRQIAEGTYDVDGKLGFILDRLLKDVLS